jgi:hypothetical protein
VGASQPAPLHLLSKNTLVFSEDLQADSDVQGKLDWQVHYVDETVVRAHQHAASGKKGADKTKN